MTIWIITMSIILILIGMVLGWIIRSRAQWTVIDGIMITFSILVLVIATIKVHDDYFPEKQIPQVWDKVYIIYNSIGEPIDTLYSKRR